MAISITWGTRVIYVPKTYLTLDTGTIYKLDSDVFRLDLKDLEDDEEGIPHPDTHRHNPEVTIAGVTYAKTIEIINNYSMEFEDGQYTVIIEGSNNNFHDVLAGILVQNQVQVIPTNSAGLIVSSSAGSGTGFDDPISGRVEGSYGDAIHRILWKARGESSASTEVWEISGTVSENPPLEDVTMTLTGDATGVVLTDSNGEYVFPGLPNGSYTLTPSKTDYSFVPASTNVTVLNGDQIGKDFVGTGPISLPYTYDTTSDLSGSSGNLSAESDWTTESGLSEAQISTSNLADSNSYTPSGVTKIISTDWNGTRDGTILDLPGTIASSETVIRIAMLAYAAESNRLPSMGLYDVTAAEANAGTPAILGQLAYFPAINGNPDQLYSYSKYESTTQRNEFWATVASANVLSTRWHWIRFQWDFAAGDLDCWAVRAEDNAEIWTLNATMHSDGTTLGHVPTGIKSVEVSNQQSGSTSRIARFWIGNGGDSWPTT